jgi:hypothetical protein
MRGDITCKVSFFDAVLAEQMIVLWFKDCDMTRDLT